ncbi:MAG: hypothetical protein Q8N56_04555 [bacterium]|nr:hypothetical protein [bacterium]
MDIASEKRVWLITVDMGYGHQRTSDDLRFLAVDDKAINANNYEDMPDSDRKLWQASRKFYEAISAFKRVPLIGNLVFAVFDFSQRVPQFYPKRDLSRPDFILKQIYSLIKNGWGKDLIEKLKKNPLPLVSTFFTPAFMAEFFGYPGEIFCTVCDTDMSRTWVPLDPEKSKIKYFAPTERVAERLKLYGVRKENIFLTGYPLPMDIIGGEDLSVLKEDLKQRLSVLDPNKKFLDKYRELVEKNLGPMPLQSNRPLTITFAVGGAGAQKQLAITALGSLKKLILEGKVRMVLVAGIKEGIRDYFRDRIQSLGLAGELGRGVEILFTPTIREYFRQFNANLRTTDVLWTKPSELSFFAALGLPIIIAPTIGSHEEFNKRWLLKSDFGILQKEPRFTDEWLMDLVDQGYLAERAFESFLEGEKLGALNIKKIIDSICFGS